jgi:hypothetical protein
VICLERKCYDKMHILILSLIFLCFCFLFFGILAFGFGFEKKTMGSYICICYWSRVYERGR